jgi:hypothetical protein
MERLYVAVDPLYNALSLATVFAENAFQEHGQQ